MVSLDNTNIYNIKLDDEYNRCKLPEDMDEGIDCMVTSILHDLSLSDIRI